MTCTVLCPAECWASSDAGWSSNSPIDVQYCCCLSLLYISWWQQFTAAAFVQSICQVTSVSWHTLNCALFLHCTGTSWLIQESSWNISS